MGKLKVIDPGIFTTIQDSGRFGFRHYGIPVSGVMDEYSYRLVNRIVGNSGGSPVLEHTLRGGKYRFKSEAVIALSGADMKATINGKSVQLYKRIEVKSGDELILNYAERGCRTYMAIRGFWKIDKVLGSYSTFVTGNFGGIEGRTLDNGDEICWSENHEESKEESQLPKDEIPYFSSKITVNLNPGPEFNFLDGSSKKYLESENFEVDPDSNRMGIRLKSNQKIHCEKSEITSSAVFPGIVQLPSSGNPIILMKDAQTVGGYPRIGVIEEPDLSRLAQLKPGSKVRFKLKKAE